MSTRSYTALTAPAPPEVTDGRIRSLRIAGRVAATALALLAASGAYVAIARLWFEAALPPPALSQTLVVVAMLSFSVWLWMARRNLDDWRVGGQLLQRHWAIGGWFMPWAGLLDPLHWLPKIVINIVVPVVFLIAPTLIAHGVANGSRTEPDETEPAAARTPLVWSWAVAAAGAMWATSTYAADGAATAPVVTTAGGVLTLATAALSIVLIKTITAQQATRHRSAQTRLLVKSTKL